MSHIYSTLHRVVIMIQPYHSLGQGCVTFLVGGPYNITSDIKRATLKIYLFHVHNKFKNSHNIFNILTYIYLTYRVNHDRPF